MKPSPAMQTAAERRVKPRPIAVVVAKDTTLVTPEEEAQALLWDAVREARSVRLAHPSWCPCNIGDTSLDDCTCWVSSAWAMRHRLKAVAARVGRLANGKQRPRSPSGGSA